MHFSLRLPRAGSSRRARWRVLGAVAALVALVGIVAGVLAVRAATMPPTYTHAATGQPLDGLVCRPDPPQRIHYHLYLAIYSQGQRVAVPGGVGIVAPAHARGQTALARTGTTTCYYNAHTHDASGIIHVEQEQPQTVTLGAFFDLWGEPLDSAHLLGQRGDAAHPVRAYLSEDGGPMQRVAGDPAAIILTPHATIYLLLDSPHVTPVPYTAWHGL